MKKKKGTALSSTIITINKCVQHEFFLEEKFEAGIVLQGWEVKALRAAKVDINNSYVFLKNGEAFLFGASFTPLSSASSYFFRDTKRTRKLLLKQRELNFLHQCTHQKGYTIIVLSLHWKETWCKVKISVARSKRKYDKRFNIKEREWKIDQTRIIKNTKKDLLSIRSIKSLNKLKI